ncbi:MAG: laminin G, partial [Rhodothermia bacterium]|nr:laminin G [Rhodothermia bacterium]
MTAEIVIASFLRGAIFVPACVFLAAVAGVSFAYAQQVGIARIEQMPNLPSPYEMRDWKQVATGYDAMVFDFTLTGTYLPLGWRVANTVNYPEHGSFGLTTVVGTPRQNSAEAINVLPALISATLVGIDKSNQNGDNWVLMAEEFFNRRPEENVYLNLPVTQSGDDWWYETMPNVFFYQLRDLYPNTGDFDNQFTTVANRWLEAVAAMGGSATPWTVPNMNYRAWSLSAMTPRTDGVREPEAAGAIGWLLYNAFVETGEERYRIGAEWALEFLSSRTSNPSYEIQLPYGVYAAARMNAELGTAYDIEKMLNWCFEVGPLRSWGTLVGTWGGYDVHGLVGEDSFNDYAFLMNGFQHAGALVPMVRYDDRFAHAIGKWVVNLANASRLFYPNYLPASHQDSEEWSFEYDPDSYIGHEALRQEKFGLRPYATGDAVDGGWGFTNLVLYGSSHAGILGGIVDTTEVPGLLRLDLLKTDYYAAPA